jgi:hypothetical protein
MTVETRHLPPPPSSASGGSYRRSIALVLIVSVLCAAAVCSAVAFRGAWPGLSPEVLLPTPSTTVVTQEAAEASAGWAGFTSTNGLGILHAHHFDERFESWAVLWSGSPEAVGAFLASGRFTTDRGTCFETWLRDRGPTTIGGCRTAHDRWRRPDGEWIDRTITTGTLPDGTYIVYLEALDPE